MIARSASSETGLGDGDRGAAALIDHEPEIIARLRDRGVVDVAQLAHVEMIARALLRQRGALIVAVLKQRQFVGSAARGDLLNRGGIGNTRLAAHGKIGARAEENTSELQSLLRISSAVFYLQKKKHIQ